MFESFFAAVIAAPVLPLNSLAIFAHDGHMGDWDGGWWIAMVFMMVIFWGAVIALAIWAIRSFGGPQQQQQQKTALDIAKERLAKGEITEEEFERIKRQLM